MGFIEILKSLSGNERSGTNSFPGPALTIMLRNGFLKKKGEKVPLAKEGWSNLLRRSGGL